MSNPYPGGGVNDTQRQTINLAVLHHTVTPENYTWKQLSDIGKTRTYAGYDHSYHYDPETGEETFIAYHYIVYKDGSYRRCLPDSACGWHCGNWEKNCRSIGIASIGDFSNQDPTEAQLQTIANIIRPYDRAVGGKLDILGHKEIAATACPGRILNFRDQIVSLVNTDPATPDPCANFKQQLAETSQKLTDTQMEVEACRIDLGSKNVVIDQQTQRIADLEAELGAALMKIQPLEIRIYEQDQTIAKHAEQMAVAENQLEEKDAKLGAQRDQIATLNTRVEQLITQNTQLEQQTIQAASDRAISSEFWRRLWDRIFRKKVS